MSHSPSSTLSYGPPSEPAPEPWTPAGMRPGRLVGRIALAATVVGVVGGALSGLMTLFLLFNEGSVARTAGLWLPAVLFVFIGWQLASNFRGKHRGPVAFGLAAVGTLVVLVLRLPVFDQFADDLEINGPAVWYPVALGALYGLLVAAVTTAVLVSATLLSRAVGVRVSLAGAQVLLTAAVMVTAWLMALWPTGIDLPILTAVGLAGVGAVLTSRWVLDGRRLPG